ncbi:MAG: hypothetical protein ACI9FO_000061 [Methylophagaceae bacterium]|jgi:hypothetical protein
MKILKLSSIILLSSLAFSAHSAVVTFDDASTTTSYENILDGYAGFNWGGMYVMQPVPAGYSDSGYNTGRVSGDFVAWNYAPTTVSAASGGTFDFTGAHFASAWIANLDIVIEGWSAGSQLFSDTISIVDTGPTWFGANYAGIDQLKIIGSNNFVLDDFTYNENLPGVPIPAAAFMFAPALLGFMGLRRRAKNAVA